MTSPSDTSPKRVCVLVLGDVGRSPRMQYHSISLADNGLAVDLVGFKGSELQPRVVESDLIDCHYIREAPQSLNRLPRIMVYVLKTLWQSLVLLFSLLRLPKPNHILVQNPPSIPTLAIAWMVCRLRGSHLVIDWHNYGFTILSLTLSESYFLVRICKWVETYFGSKADHNFCVTNAMKDDLRNNFNIRASVLYDRPPALFSALSVKEKHNLLMRLKSEFKELGNESKEETLLTKYDLKSDKIVMKSKRTALVMSSTSWTEDEDFNILFEALDKYDQKVKNSNQWPDIVCAVTGKGPLKEFYRQKILLKNFSSVKVIFPWLSPEDYSKFVAACDLGISLHKSSSNLDLPMKVVDMFGCFLPVCAYDYKCINELVLNGQNGLLFQTSDQLCEHLLTVFKDFNGKSKILDNFRKNLEKNYDLKNRWHQYWNENALTVFNR